MDSTPCETLLEIKPSRKLDQGRACTRNTTSMIDLKQAWLEDSIVKAFSRSPEVTNTRVWFDAQLAAYSDKSALSTSGLEVTFQGKIRSRLGGILRKLGAIARLQLRQE
ncbi:hypothetical protein Ae201684P_007305 [Aphanomyces euteiches]|uniref:Uncharacterized protein n=1 Tax=Aphanomyces euteiches TaxID=100861 RepID=A0A6G0WQY0_9STRA|nr:hypothetical protein Ae201684_012615 [Aphanomyces euteiches]KAH9101120.1 hypothetical protein Ae201684P_007305 [Aphanomyces euteiches]